MRNNSMSRFSGFVILIIIFIFFLIGLKIGGDYTVTSNNLFEQAKTEFEENINQPNNNYQNKTLAPVEKLPNKVAHKIDEIIQKIVNRVLDTN